MLPSIEDALDRLRRSRFRRRFHLNSADAAYLQTRGLAAVMAHAAAFVDDRLAPARLRNDGRQTPMRGHPVFVAQHATAACCRGCLSRWHDIPAGESLSGEERAYVLRLIEAWLIRQGALELTADVAVGVGERGPFDL